MTRLSRGTSIFDQSRGVLRFLLVLSLLMMGPGTLRAHPILQNPLWIELTPERLQVRLYVSVRELNVVQGLPISTDGTVDMEMAQEMAPRHSGYALDHLQFSGDGVLLKGGVVEILPPQRIGAGPEAPDRAHFIYVIHYPLKAPPARLVFSHTMVKEFPSAPGVDWDLSYAYRFGPPGTTPKDFGALPRGMEVVFQTGYAPLPGAAAAPAPPQLAILIRLALLGAALGLGFTGHRRGILKLIGMAVFFFAAGWGASAVTGWQMPGFLAAALGGVGILLAAVDNIHRAPVTEGGSGTRRWLIAGFFSAVAGFSIAGGEDTMGSRLLVFAGGLGMLAAAMVLGGALASFRFGQPGKQGTSSAASAGGRAFLQVASLLICVGGLAILFDGLGIRPWDHWIERLGR